MKTPSFWKSKNIISILLYPISLLYHLGYKVRCAINYKKYKSETPVICVGNLVMGGAGKTPTAIFISKFLKKMNKTYCFLSKGYTGNITKPTRVDLNSHTSKDVGDEPLLLAEYGDVYISKNRVEGLKYINSLVGKYDYIIMDDGLQNPTFIKDYSVIVVNGKFGFGNNMLFPSGPLRDKLKNMKGKVNRVIIIDRDEYGITKLCKKYKLKCSYLETKFNIQKIMLERKFIAFSGIANTDKFFNSLDECLMNTVERITFPDHHNFHNTDIEILVDMTDNWNYGLITTKKDWVRLKKKHRDDILYLDMSLRLAKKKRENKDGEIY